MTTTADEIWEILARITTKRAELISQQKELVTAQKETERILVVFPCIQLVKE